MPMSHRSRSRSRSRRPIAVAAAAAADIWFPFTTQDYYVVIRLRWFVSIIIRQSSWVCFSPQGASIQEAERCSISPKAHEFVAFACCCYLSMWGRACRFADSLLRIAPNWRVQTCSDAFACCCNLLMWSRCCPIAIAAIAAIAHCKRALYKFSLDLRMIEKRSY